MKRRYKLILIIVFAISIILVIYFLFFKEKKIYVSIGKSNKLLTYTFEDLISNNKEYIYKNLKNGDEILGNVIDKIKKNQQNINYYLKNADIITIFLDGSELNNYKKLNNKIIENYLNEIETLFQLLHKKNNMIYCINIKNEQYINNYIKQLAKNYKINYYEVKNTLISNHKIYLTHSENIQIYNIIKKGIVN